MATWRKAAMMAATGTREFDMTKSAPLPLEDISSQRLYDELKRRGVIKDKLFGPAQQEWVTEIPIMQQSVLFAAIRAPDGLKKNHPVKVLMRWYRRSILLSAFDKRALNNPFEEGGGSFTGPFTKDHARSIFNLDSTLNGPMPQYWFDETRKMYLEHVDEIPHHFQLHLMHAAQIVGCHHPDEQIRAWWRRFYLMIVNDAHLHPETDEEMNIRLSDNSEEWIKREEVTAQ